MLHVQSLKLLNSRPLRCDLGVSMSQQNCNVALSICILMLFNFAWEATRYKKIMWRVNSTTEKTLNPHVFLGKV